MFRDLVNRSELAALFASTGAAAVIVNSPKNVFYYTGSPTALPHIHMTPWYHPSHPAWKVALVLASGRSTLFVEHEDLAVSQARAWSESRPFDRNTGSAEEALAAYLNERGLQESIVGYEANYLSAATYRRLRRLLPKVRLTPLDDGLDRVRSVKTSEEIAAIKRSADLLDEAMLAAFSEAREGDSEWQLHASIIANALDLGADYCRGGMLTGENTKTPFKPIGDRRLQHGDLVYADYAAFIDGYPSNQSRHAVVGAPSPEQERMYRITVEVERDLIRYMRPGISGREVLLHCRELVARHGMRHSAVMAGHSIGLGYQERPLLTEHETTPLRDGNVIAVEPMLPPTQRYTVQDLVLIREGGNVLLSDRFDTDEMFVIKGRRR